VADDRPLPNPAPAGSRGAGLVTHYLLAAIAGGTNRLALLPPVAAAGIVYLLVVLALGWLVSLWTVEDRALLDRVTGMVR
jgi:hypothetical protein